MKQLSLKKKYKWRYVAFASQGMVLQRVWLTVLRMSYSGTFLVVYLAESVSGGSSGEVGVTQHFGPSPSMRVSGRGG